MSNNTLLPYDALRAKGIALSRVQLWRLEKTGRFPKRVRVTEARIAWVETEIDAWLGKRIAARDVSRVAA